MLETNPNGFTIKNTAYSPDPETNVYDTIDGQTFQFDAIEQTTFDPTTGLYIAYDYKGNRALMDNNSSFSDPERRYIHDTHGRLRIEEEWADGSSYHVTDIANLYAPPHECGCSDPGPFYLETLTFDASNSLMVSTQRAPGVMMTGGGSAAGTSPNTVTGLPSGSFAGNGACVLEFVDDGTNQKWNFRHENQLGSLIGMTDASGNRIAEIDYDEYC